MADHPRVIFLPRPNYCYLAHPHLPNANGRPQTFLGILQARLDAGMTMGSMELEMIRLDKRVY